MLLNLYHHSIMKSRNFNSRAVKITGPVLGIDISFTICDSDTSCKVVDKRRTRFSHVCNGTSSSKSEGNKRLGLSCLHELIPELYSQKQPDS